MAVVVHDILLKLIEHLVGYCEDVLLSSLFWLLFFNGPEVYHPFHMLHERYAIR